jgi:hypothetical protein
MPPCRIPAAVAEMPHKWLKPPRTWPGITTAPVYRACNRSRLPCPRAAQGLLTSKHRKPCRMMRSFCPPSESRRASTMASESVRAECCGRMRMIGSDEFEFRRSRPTPLPVRCQGELHLSPSCNAWTPGGKTLRWIKHVFAGVAALGKAIALFPHDYHAFNLVIYVCSHRVS